MLQFVSIRSATTRMLTNVRMGSGATAPAKSLEKFPYIRNLDLKREPRLFSPASASAPSEAQRFSFLCVRRTEPSVTVRSRAIRAFARHPRSGRGSCAEHSLHGAFADFGAFGAFGALHALALTRVWRLTPRSTRTRPRCTLHAAAASAAPASASASALFSLAADPQNYARAPHGFAHCWR